MKGYEMDQRQEWVVEAEDVCYTYEGNETPALNHFSLRIARGSRVAVMGGNGSGKSTFFLCLNGIRRPDRGRILIDGKPVSYTRKGLLDVRRKTGIVFQDPDDQLFSASVYEDMSFGVLNLGMDEAQARRAVEHTAEEIGLTALLDRPVHALSGGQKKLAAIADILVMGPEIMILDEPAASLDQMHTDLVRKVIAELSDKGITILTATHDMDYAYEWADMIVVMKDGEILRKGTPREVCTDRRLLEQAHLKPPVVLEMYESLKKSGIISAGEEPPGSMKELEKILTGRNVVRGGISEMEQTPNAEENN